MERLRFSELGFRKAGEAERDRAGQGQSPQHWQKEALGTVVLKEELLGRNHPMEGAN